MIPLSKKYFTLILLLLLGCTIWLRLYHIESRPLHHDESLHAHYSYIQTHHFQKNHYRYNPMLHGPLLYDLTSLTILLGENSKTYWRLIPAIFGILTVLLLAYIFRGSSPPSQILILTLFTFSPILIYWSRFLRNEPLIIFFQLSLLFLMLYGNQKWKVLLFFPLLAIQFTLKENAYITTIFFCVLLIVDYIEYNIPLNIKKYKGRWSLGVIISLFIYVLLYSSFFQHPAGILEGLYKKSLVYWFQQHQKARIDAPFSFLTLVFIHNAPIIFFSICITTLLDFRKSLMQNLKSWHFYLLPFLFLLFIFIKSTTLKVAADYFVATGIFISTFMLYEYLKENREIFFSYFLLVASYFTYSFVGEKVPWLALYPYVFAMIYLFYRWRKFWDKSSTRIKLIFISIYLLVSALINYRINFTYSPKQIIHQVGSTHQLEDVLKLTKNRATLVYGKIIWPLHTFLERNPLYKHHANRYTDLTQFNYIFLDNHNNLRWSGKLSKKFSHKRLLYREYWWPSIDEYDLTTFFLSTPWSITLNQQTTKQYLHFYQKL